MILYGIALGSNTGDRLGHLQAAVAELAAHGRVTAVSAVYETTPVDCAPDAGDFLNAALLLESELEPEALLARLREIERARGRVQHGPRNAPRPLDLDILFAGDRAVRTEHLEIPHPRLAGRRFVLEPLAEIAPERVPPGFQQSVEKLLKTLVSSEPPLRRFARLDLPARDRRGETAEKLAAFASLKPNGKPVVSLTAGDYPTGRLLDESGEVDLILVGDSLGMVVLGYPDTVEVTLSEMLHHTRAVRRGVRRALLAADLPFQTYQTPEAAVSSARALVAAGADAVKLEGGVEMLPQIRAIIGAGIAVIGHIGMLPQQVRAEGGYKKKGKTPDAAAKLLEDARALDQAGVLAIVLESMTPAAAETITKAVKCPTIGIGAGTACDGQILVTADLTGAFPWFRPPFAKARGDVAGEIRRAIREYAAEARGAAPGAN